MKDQSYPNFYFIFESRKRVFIENILDSSTLTEKGDTLSIIKLIGRQYSCLMAVMDKINICFSFQVCRINIFNLKYFLFNDILYTVFIIRILY